jgi:cysteinyl-tRNA synthetase
VLRLTNSLTGDKVEFTPRDPGKASVYWCGPTVYDAPHVGHARSTLAFDILVRYLRWTGLDVTAVSNITDIDDNIIARAAEEGTTEPELARRFEEIFIAEMDRLDIAHPDLRPRATEYVGPMVDIIGQLVDRGMAYATDSGVYYDVDRLDGYGALAGQTIEQLREGAGARIEVDEDKTDPLDFALWKAAKPGEPTWDSPWGPGRPGWHIECVAMSLDLLGDGFDIHGGGDDLTFPHHENERAECLGCGRPFARLWVHNGMVQVGTEKMSKSLGNFWTLAELLDNWDPRALRLLVLQTHYRKTMEIGEDTLRTASAALEDHEHTRRSREMVLNGKRYFYDQLKAMGVEYLPSESSFVMINTKADSDDIVNKLRDEYNVLVGNARARWGIQGWLRATAGLPEENEAFISALKKVLVSS